MGVKAELQWNNVLLIVSKPVYVVIHLGSTLMSAAMHGDENSYCFNILFHNICTYMCRATTVPVCV